MATVSISLYQIRETTTEGYRVINEITASVDIEEQLFTFKFIDGTGPEWLGGNDQYQHVSTVSDNKNYPAVTAFPYSPTTPVDYYRYKKVVLDYGSLNGAIDQAAITKTRMEELATDWQTAVDAFEGTTDYDYQSADGQVSFTLEQVQSQPANNNFRVVSTIKASPVPVGIDRELFLYEPDGGAPPDPLTDTFIRVVTTDDISRYPTAAGWTTEAYYRSEYAQVDNALLGDAETHSETVRTDLEALAQDYDTSSDDFVGSETTVYTG